jgi:hypothetical protein
MACGVGRVLLFDPTNADNAPYNPPLEVPLGEREVRDVQNINHVPVDPEGALERRNRSEKTSHSTLHLAGPRRPTARWDVTRGLLNLAKCLKNQIT